MTTDIYQYIKEEEVRYNTTPVPIVEGWDWHMAKHVKLTTLYLNSQYETGKEDDKPFKNIILPAINLQHRAVEFSVKELVPFVMDPDNSYKSFLVKKYHDYWARRANLASFLDQLTETYTDYGGCLVKKTANAIPEVVPFQRLAFCDQTDILGGPICEKHQYTPDQLYEMKKQGWENIDEVLLLSLDNTKNTTQSNQTVATPGKYIGVYELHGVLPEYFFNEKEDSLIRYSRQMHIVSLYTDREGNKQGITLFKKKIKENPYKFISRDYIYGRALGRGAVEELFEPQVWTNYSVIKGLELLDQASAIYYKTTDEQFANRNRTINAPTGTVFKLEQGHDIAPFNNSPVNLNAFYNNMQIWEASAKDQSASYDAITGKADNTGMPFRLGYMLNQEAHSLHKYRKGQVGIFLTELYKDWILPEIADQINNGDQFLAELSSDEMQYVIESVQDNLWSKKLVQLVIKEKKLISKEDQETYKQGIKELMAKKGNKQFFKALKDEIKDIPIDVDIVTTNEQKDMSMVAEKLSSVFSEVARNPQILENPTLRKLFNQILENSGLHSIDYMPNMAIN